MNWITLEQAAALTKHDKDTLTALLTNPDLSQVQTELQQRGIRFDRKRWETNQPAFGLIVQPENPFADNTLRIVITLHPQQNRTRQLLVAITNNNEFPIAQTHKLTASSETLTIAEITEQLLPVLQQMLETFSQALPERILTSSIAKESKSTAQPNQNDPVAPKKPQARLAQSSSQISLI